MNAELNRLQMADKYILHQILSDEKVIQYTLFSKMTIIESEQYLIKALNQYSLDLPLSYTTGIRLSDNGELIGICGLVFDNRREQGEIWYLLSKPFWGKGLASQVLPQLLQYGFMKLELHRIWANCLPENKASKRVLEKLGFRKEGLQKRSLRIQGVWCDSLVYAILSSEWQNIDCIHTEKLIRV